MYIQTPICMADFPIDGQKTKFVSHKKMKLLLVQKYVNTFIS